ncbi:MAG: ribosome-associated translation inhibitor RaiA [Patescibacteria group bacterium]|jgi:putative sigma-54 modulation protein
MKITMSGSQLEMTEAMQKYVEKKFASLEKFFDRILDTKVTLGLETHHRVKGEIFFAECKMQVPGKDLFAKQTAKDIYSAIDLLRDELEAELKKYKQRLRGNVKKNKNVARGNKEYDEKAGE